LRKSNFPRKVGVQFVSGNGRESAPFLFRTHDPRECSRTWHVDRVRFDPLLIERAKELGAEFHAGTRVREMLFDGNRATGVRLLHDGVEKSIHAPVVVDATGQHALLADKLELRRLNPKFRKASIWGHFRGAQREVIDGGVMTLILRSQNEPNWFWHIPLADDVTSVGVVGDVGLLLRRRSTTEHAFAEEVARCPGIAERLAGAERIGELKIVKEFSYSTEQAAGDGWVLVGDAWGFIDPIYSSGVFFALKSAEMAADAIIDGLQRGNTSGEQLGRWAPEFSEATRWIRKLVDAFYSGQFRVGKFVAEYPQHQGNLTDLLIGRIFQPGVGAIFEDLDPWLQRMESETADVS
jgi:flavin-dependent dehydrogenase